MTYHRLALWAVAAAFVLAVGKGSPAGSASLQGEWAADNLRMGCAPMGMDVVIQLPDSKGEQQEEASIKDDIWNAAEWRLRSAGIFRPLTEIYDNRSALIAQVPPYDKTDPRANPLEGIVKIRRIKTENPLQWLVFSLLGVGDATAVSLALYRRVTFLAGGGGEQAVIVWEHNAVQSHADDQGRQTMLMQLLDTFLTAYLRANPECEGRIGAR